MLNKVWAITINSFKEAIRRKILYVFLFSAIGIIFVGRFFNFLSPSNETKIAIDMGLAGILFFGALIAIFSCGELIPREIEKQTIITLLSKPIKRIEFLAGKFLGGFLLVFVNFLLMSIVFLVIIYFKEKTVSIDLVKALLLTFWELIVLSSIAVCLSILSSTVAFNVTVTFSI
ncbi:MAG: ABC transporter permease subunit, partial [Candidatus Omnitrophica bacterium]|nr:ABC transporter permease subunit [Candidatus Omnitrophota bacterium]